MTDDEIDVAWSSSVAELAADALVDAGLLTKVDFDKAQNIIMEELRVRLALGDRPDRKNSRCKPS
jgi:hypothetical protein